MAASGGTAPVTATSDDSATGGGGAPSSSVHAASWECPLCLSPVGRRTLAPRLGHLASCALLNAVPIERARALAQVDDKAWAKYLKAQASAGAPKPSSGATKVATKKAARPLTLDAALSSTRAGSGVGTALAHLKRGRGAAATASAAGLPAAASGASSSSSSGPNEGRWELDNGVFLLGQHFAIPRPPHQQHSIAQLERMADATAPLPTPASAASSTDASAATPSAAASSPSAASVPSSSPSLSLSAQLYAWRQYVHELDQVMVQMQTRRQWAMLKFRRLQERLESETAALMPDLQARSADCADVARDMEVDSAQVADEKAPSSTPPTATPSSSMWSLCSTPLSTLPSAEFLSHLPLQNLRDSNATRASDTPMSATATSSSVSATPIASAAPQLPLLTPINSSAATPSSRPPHPPAVLVPAAPTIANIWARKSSSTPTARSSLPPGSVAVTPSLDHLPLASSFAQNVLHVGASAALPPPQPHPQPPPAAAEPLSTHFSPLRPAAAVPSAPNSPGLLLPPTAAEPMEMETSHAPMTAVDPAVVPRYAAAPLSAAVHQPPPPPPHLLPLALSAVQQTICMAVQVPTPLPLPLPLSPTEEGCADSPSRASPSKRPCLDLDDDMPPLSMPPLERPGETAALGRGASSLVADVEMKAVEALDMTIPETPSSALAATPLPAERKEPPSVTPIPISFASPVQAVWHTAASLLSGESSHSALTLSPPSLNSSQNSQPGLERPTPLRGAARQEPEVAPRPTEEEKDGEFGEPSAARPERRESSSVASRLLNASSYPSSSSPLSAPPPCELVSAAVIELLSDEEDVASRRKQAAISSHGEASPSPHAASSFQHVTTSRRRAAAPLESLSDDEVEVTDFKPTASYRPSSRNTTPTDMRSIFSPSTAAIAAATGAATPTATVPSSAPSQWQPASARKLWADKTAPALAAAAPSAFLPIGLPPPASMVAVVAATVGPGAAPASSVALAPATRDGSSPQPRQKKPRKADLLPSGTVSPGGASSSSSSFSSMSASLAAGPAALSTSAAAAASASSSSSGVPCLFKIGSSSAMASTFGGCCTPSFESYSVDDLKALMATFGLKTKSKNQMATKLQELWTQIANRKVDSVNAHHTLAHASSTPSAPSAPAPYAANSSPDTTPVLGPLIAPAAITPTAAAQPAPAKTKRPRTKKVQDPSSASAADASSRSATPVLDVRRTPPPLMDITLQQSNGGAALLSAQTALPAPDSGVATKKRKAPTTATAPSAARGSNELAAGPAPASAPAAGASSVPAALSHSIRTFLRSQTDLYLRILMFQPLEIAELAFVMADVGGISVPPKVLRDFLDEEGVATCCRPPGATKRDPAKDDAGQPAAAKGRYKVAKATRKKQQ